MQNYMRRFGFYRNPPLDYPSDQMIPSGARLYVPKPKPHYDLIPVTNRHVDLGRTAIGQDLLSVTPMQMAMVASAVADNGTLDGTTPLLQGRQPGGPDRSSLARARLSPRHIPDCRKGDAVDDD